MFSRAFIQRWSNVRDFVLTGSRLKKAAVAVLGFIAITVPGKLAEDRIVGGTNRYIDTHANSLLGYCLVLLSGIVQHPILGVLGFCCVVLMALTVHAYFETRPIKPLVISVPRKPQLVWSAFQFVDATYDKDSGIWREQWSHYSRKAFVLHFANLPYEDGKGIAASNVRAQIIWQYSHGVPGPAFLPAAWIDEDRGMVDIPVGCSKKLIIGIKCDSLPGAHYWDGYSNPRMEQGDKHRLDGQMVPSDGVLLVKLIGATDEVWYEQKWEWKEDFEHGAHPSIRQL